VYTLLTRNTKIHNKADMVKCCSCMRLEVL